MHDRLFKGREFILRLYQTDERNLFSSLRAPREHAFLIFADKRDPVIQTERN